MLPLAKPALATLAVFYFMNNWNDFLWPLVMTSTTNMRNLPAGLTLFAGAVRGRARRADGRARSSASSRWPWPSLLAQRYFVQGIATTGIK